MPLTIHLIRHGKSAFTFNEPITGAELKDWIDNYDAFGIHEQSCPPEETLIKVKRSSFVLTSDLRRSIESAQKLVPDIQLNSEPIFKEIDLPAVPFKGLKLKPHFWIFFNRFLWLLGFDFPGIESAKAARKRAKESAKLLIEYAETYQEIALIGHSLFNMFIAIELRKKGWKGLLMPTWDNWACTSYTK